MHLYGFSTKNNALQAQLDSVQEAHAKIDAKRDIDEARLNERLCNAEAEKREIERYAKIIFPDTNCCQTIDRNRMYEKRGRGSIETGIREVMFPSFCCP